MGETLRVDARSLRLILVRHAQTASNAERRYMGQEDSPLTKAGRMQAAAVAARLAHQGIDALYTSDLGRASTTAEAISAACQVPLTSDERLRERHAGGFQGLLLSEAQDRYPDHFLADRPPTPQTAPPGGESALQVQARVSPLLEEIRQRHDRQRVVLVTHGGVIRTLL